MTTRFATFAVAGALALTGLQCAAEEVEAQAPADTAPAAKAPAAEEAVTASELVAAFDSVTAFASVKALSENELGEQRAAAKLELEEVTINDADADGVVAGNAALNNRTGGNTIAGDAFVGANGFIHSVQNTGNNVLIQNSTVINVSVEP